MDSLHVVIVGGAIGGSAAALLLARAGARVTLLERIAHPRAVGAGIAIAPNGFAVLESLGLGPALASARVIPQPRIVDGAGHTLVAPPPGATIRMLRRSTLQAVLLDAVAAESRIAFRMGAEVMDACRDGTVRVRTAAGIETIRADLVLGADGVHSRVRDAGNFGARVRRSGIRYVRALVDGIVAREEEAWTGAGIFGSFATDRGAYVYASAGSRALRAAVEAHDLDAFRRSWAQAYAPAAGILAAVPSWEAMLVNDVMRVDCARWHDWRLVLLGDAAHAMAPNLGQGANSALVDAAVLLDGLRRGETLEAALAAYEQRRRPAVRRVATMAARLGALSEHTSAPGRWLRDRVLLPVIQRIAPDPAPAVLQEPADFLLSIGRA